MNTKFLTGTSIASVPQISTVWSVNDVLETIRVRWSIGRMNYKVETGLYAVGNPTEISPVFVTANFKLSFDHVRRALYGMDAWLLILDTKGINVWCAAGKGTFGTKELCRQIKLVELEKIVSHYNKTEAIHKSVFFEPYSGPIKTDNNLRWCPS